GRSLYRETVGAVSSYSSEYRHGAADRSLLRTVASATGGRVGISADRAFDANLPAGRRRVEVWPWLTWLAALLLPLDVALRRVVLTREDLTAARRWRPWGMRPAPAVARSQRMSRLLDTKERVRERPNVEPSPAEESSSPPPRPASPSPERAPEPAPPPESESPGTAEETTGVSELLRRKRERGSGPT
ncbi:MAG: hypothetical protein ACRDKZ_16245, partial [Actinomycetota bacterium]